MFVFCLFVFFRVAHVAHGSSQVRGTIRAAAAGLRQNHSNTRSELCLQHYTTAQGNAGSSTHWRMPGIEAVTSCFLVGFLSTAPWQELLCFYDFLKNFYWYSQSGVLARRAVGKEKCFNFKQNKTCLGWNNESKI